MDMKLGLLLFSLLTVVLGDGCQLSPLADCELNVNCQKTLDKLEEINSNECVKLETKTPVITLQIENVNMDEANLEKLKSLHEKVLKHIINLELINGGLQSVPDIINQMDKLQYIDLSKNKMTSIDISKLTNSVLKRIYIKNNEIFDLIKSVTTHEDTTVTEIDLSDNQIQSIPDKYFETFRSLTTLNLSNNKVSSININKICLLNKKLKSFTINNNTINELGEIDSTDVVSDVTNIDLSHNQIDSIPNYYFKQFTALERLDLSHNSIEKLNNEIFVGLQSLKKIFLSFNKLKKVGNVFLRLEDLELLTLNNNLLDAIKLDAFTTLLKLKKLNLASNNLKDDVTAALNTLSYLTSLDLSNNSLTIIQKSSFKKNFALEDLNLSDNKIHTLEPEAFKGKSINKFNFKNNKLVGPLESTMLDGLFPTELDLSHGGITEIGQACFSNMSSLQKLWLNNNEINKIDYLAFNNNLALTHLDISTNKISQLSFKTDHLQELTNLTVSHNAITQCNRDVFKNFISMTYLDLSNNEITDIQPNTFEKMEKLETLDLHRNPLANINKNSFKGLNKLTKFSIQETYLKSINNEMLSDMNNLLYLDASSNQITTIETNAFKNNIKLQELYLNSNKIRDITKVLNVLINLHTLNLRKNDIQNVDTTTFNSLNNLKMIDLSFNENLHLEKPFNNIPTLKNVYLKKIKSVNFQNVENSEISGLDLSNCGITDVNTIHLNNLKKIKTLNLCNNEISSIDINSFQHMALLEKLNLCYNKIKEVKPESFDKATHLEELDLSGNKLSEISYGTFNKLENLKTINVKNNYLTDFPPGNLPDDKTDINLILDENSIKSLDFVGFFYKGISSLSIGGNLIPCSKIENTKSKYEKLQLTATNLVKNTENITNFGGITCIPNLKDDESGISNTNAIIPPPTELKELYKMFDKWLMTTNNTASTLAELSQIISEHYRKESSKSNTNLSTPTNTDMVMFFKDNMRKLIKNVNESFTKFNQQTANTFEKLNKRNGEEVLFENNIEKQMTHIIENLSNIKQQTDESKTAILKLAKQAEPSNMSNEIRKSVKEVDGRLKAFESNIKSESKTTKILAYISTVGVMVLISALVVKSVLNYQNSKAK